MTRLRQRMLDELQRRNYSPYTVRSYMQAVESFASYCHRSPDQLGPDHIREYQVHLFRDCKLSARTIQGQTAALRFLFVKTLGRTYLPNQIRFPKCGKRLPTVLSQGEVARLIECCGSLMQRAMVMTLYATGLRRAELCRLKVVDIDSQRMALHVQRGRGGRDRDVPLSPEAALCSARVLALDEAEDLPVPRHGEQLASRCADHRESGLDRRHERSEGCWAYEAGLATHAAT